MATGEAARQQQGVVKRKAFTSIIPLQKYTYKTVFSSGMKNLYLPVAGLFSHARLRGTQEVRLYTTVHVWVQAGLHGACSRRSQPRNLASNHGVAYRGARAEQDKWKTHISEFLHLFLLHCCTATQPQVRHLFQAFPVVTATDTTNAMRAWALLMCVCCVCVCVRLCAGLFMCVLALGRASFGTFF